jgi:undecaprenyl-diphosphatase
VALGLVILLALVQGVAEFLPISSSGHLRLLQELFGLEDPQTLFDVMLHVGTLVAVVWVYRERVLAVLAGAWRGLARRQGKSLAEVYRADADLRLFLLVGLGTVPTALVAIAVGTTLERWAGALGFVGMALIINALILVLLGRLVRSAPGPSGAGDQAADTPRGLDALTWRDAIWIGLAQGVAVTRGISRSGSTITAGVLLGLRQDAAAAYSFLLSIPAILGALVLTLKDFDGELSALVPGILGALVAALIGILALKLLLRLLGSGRLGLFAGYCAALGLLAVIWDLTH